MQPLLTLLEELDRLYCSETLSEYEQTLHHLEQQVQQIFPGFTIAYAEIAIVGCKREQHGGMRHVLVPASSVE